MDTNLLTEAEATEAGLITLGCDPCRQAAGLAPIHPERIAPGTWYYCPTCHAQRKVNVWSDRLPHPVDAFFGLLWVAIMVAGLAGILYLVTIDAATRYGHDYINQGHYLATVFVGALCWLVVATFATRVYALVLGALGWSLRAVWDAVRPVGRPA
jgi:hypothetical protein